MSITSRSAWSELLDAVLDVGLVAMTNIQMSRLPGRGVGGKRPIAPVRVLAQGGLLAFVAGHASGEDSQISGPGAELVTLGPVA